MKILTNEKQARRTYVTLLKMGHTEEEIATCYKNIVTPKIVCQTSLWRQLRAMMPRPFLTGWALLLTRVNSHRRRWVD